MNTTIPALTNSDASDARFPPTVEAYGELHAAYVYFNTVLFDGTLPPCLITLQHKSRRVHGYYSSKRFRSNARADLTTDEIAMNPIHFQSRNVTEVLQTLAHEMVHKWQHHFGKPSRGGYHNHQWAAKMKAIGLHPSSTGKPGGAIVGQQMADYLIEGGPLARAIEFLIANGFRISWYEREADAVAPAGFPGTDNEPRPGTSGTRVKYSCLGCGLNAWAKPNAALICAACPQPMRPFPSGAPGGGAPSPERLPQLSAPFCRALP